MMLRAPLSPEAKRTLVAAALARIAPNMYIDITGAPGGWRAQKDAAFSRTLLYWPDAWRKVL